MNSMTKEEPNAMKVFVAKRASLHIIQCLQAAVENLHGAEQACVAMDYLLFKEISDLKARVERAAFGVLDGKYKNKEYVI